jgi:hypothetical protein
LKNVNNFEKFLIKCLEIKNKALPLHPQSGSNNETECKTVLRKIFEKSYQKIWYIQKSVLSLHRFSALKKEWLRK